MKPNVMTNHIMVTIAPVHDHTRHQECNSYYRHSCVEHCFQMCPLCRPY